MLGGRAKLYFAFSLVILTAAIVLATWGFPKIVNKQIQKNVQIENSSVMFEKWRKLPMPLTFKIYVFNVTNVENVNIGEKPKLTEIGPFVYKQYRERTILGYGNNDTVKYMLKKTFHFDQEESGELTEDDIVTVINFPYMAAILSVHNMMPAMVSMINEGLQLFFPNLNDAFMTVKIRDLFFDGIYLNCAGNHSSLGLVCATIKAKPPPNMRLSEDGNGVYFSMFNYMNDTEFGPYEMVRGRENIKELGHIVSYKGRTAMSNWGDPYCNMLNGSDSTIFPPMDGEPPARLYTFEPDICRSLYASLVGARQLFNLSTYYYEISESALAAKSANPNNKCFCRNNWSKKHDGCLVMGVMNLMPCQGAPAIASLPHFYLASEELLEYFESGVRPDKEKHNTYVYMEPITGVVLRGVKRLQFNIELRAMEGVPQLENVKTGLFPLLWIEEGAEIPESLLEELKHSHTLLSYVETARWLILAIAVVVAIICAVAVAKTGVGSLPVWPTNSVTFIHKPGNSLNLNKQ